MLRELIEQHPFLTVIEDASDDDSLAVLDRRSGLCVCVSDDLALDDLIDNGAEWYLNSPYNLAS